jgi:hypothetical protein
MAIKLSVTVRNARLDAIETVIGASAVLKIRTLAPPTNITDADTGTVLATLNLPADWMNAASGGSMTKSASAWQDAAADAAGTAGHFRIYASNGTTQHVQGTVTATGGGGDLELDNVVLAVGQQVTTPEQRLALLRRLSDDERAQLRALLAKALAGPSDSSAGPSDQGDLEPDLEPGSGAPELLGRPRNVGRALAPEVVEPELGQVSLAAYARKRTHNGRSSRPARTMPACSLPVRRPIRHGPILIARRPPPRVRPVAPRAGRGRGRPGDVGRAMPGDNDAGAPRSPSSASRPRRSRGLSANGRTRSHGAIPGTYPIGPGPPRRVPAAGSRAGRGRRSTGDGPAGDAGPATPHSSVSTITRRRALTSAPRSPTPISCRIGGDRAGRGMCMGSASSGSSSRRISG